MSGPWHVHQPRRASPIGQCSISSDCASRLPRRSTAVVSRSMTASRGRSRVGTASSRCDCGPPRSLAKPATPLRHGADDVEDGLAVNLRPDPSPLVDRMKASPRLPRDQQSSRASWCHWSRRRTALCPLPGDGSRRSRTSRSRVEPDHLDGGARPVHQGRASPRPECPIPDRSAGRHSAALAGTRRGPEQRFLGWARGQLRGSSASNTRAATPPSNATSGEHRLVVAERTVARIAARAVCGTAAPPVKWWVRRPADDAPMFEAAASSAGTRAEQPNRRPGVQSRAAFDQGPRVGVRIRVPDASSRANGVRGWRV